MIELGSNGRTSVKEYLGSDANTIVYTQVSTCITVTALVGNKLAGIHLFRGTPQSYTDEDLEKFGKQAAGATALSIVGMISDGGWDSETNVKNRTGLVYNSIGGGTLIEKLRKSTGYRGIVNVCDTSTLGRELDIRVDRAEDSMTFSYGKGTVIPLSSFSQVAGDVMPQITRTRSRSNSSGGCCVIL